MDDRKNIRNEQGKVLRIDKGHNVSIEGRKKIILTGILNVGSFNECEIVLETEMGMLTIKGSALHMSKLNLESGDLIIDGNIDSCVYSEKRDLKTKSAGFLNKMFK